MRVVGPGTPAELVIAPTPTAHFGAGALAKLPGLVKAAGGGAALVITDAVLAATPVIGSVTDELAAAGLGVRVFSGVHPNPVTADLADGAAEAAAMLAASPVLVAVGGGSSIDAAKGIALAAVNPQRGRELDYRRHFAVPGLPIVAIPTTAGTGAETNAFGVITDETEHRKFYVGHASTRPAAAILDPSLTIGLPPRPTAATGADALTHAIESYLSVRANPWSAGTALQVVRMVAAYLPRAVADGSDSEARAQMLLAAHMAGIAMASTGLGACHAIGHALGGRMNLPHGEALAMVLPEVLAFCLPGCREPLADLAFALGAGDTSATAEHNAAAAVRAVSTLLAAIGLTRTLAEAGLREAAYPAIAADALADEVLANAPRQPAKSDIIGILASAAARAA